RLRAGGAQLAAEAGQPRELEFLGRAALAERALQGLHLLRRGAELGRDDERAAHASIGELAQDAREARFGAVHDDAQARERAALLQRLRALELEPRLALRLVRAGRHDEHGRAAEVAGRERDARAVRERRERPLAAEAQAVDARGLLVAAQLAREDDARGLALAL